MKFKNDIPNIPNHLSSKFTIIRVSSHRHQFQVDNSIKYYVIYHFSCVVITDIASSRYLEISVALTYLSSGRSVMTFRSSIKWVIKYI